VRWPRGSALVLLISRGYGDASSSLGYDREVPSMVLS
jgi:hypothetical protein